MYQNVKAIDKSACADFKLQENGYDFLKGTSLIPFALDETRQVACHFPIAFTETDGKMIPVALLGQDKLGRIFNDKFEWIMNFIPKYISSYPFTVILTKNAEGKELVLPAYDADSKILNNKKGKSIIVDGKYVKEVREKLDNAKSLLASRAKAIELAELIKAYGLLSQSDKTKLYFIDRAKFDALPDDKFIELRKKSVLTLIYASIVSFSNMK